MYLGTVIQNCCVAFSQLYYYICISSLPSLNMEIQAQTILKVTFIIFVMMCMLLLLHAQSLISLMLTRIVFSAQH
jgi:hypothetical protein